ncbi:MAG: 50S ribosomal protein L15 [Actinobacteria bacterium]|nr:50S ribosomal protein L15 [Actinomycetota bacterium]
MKLSELESPKSVKKRKRVGRGNGSGHGTTSGRGTKGQLSRSGGKTRIGFEGGQMPLQRRIPHLKGFKNLRKKVFNIINVGDLENFKEDSTIDYKLLEDKGLIMKKNSPLKILGNGELTRKLTVRANAFSTNASAKIEKAGGKAEVI